MKVQSSMLDLSNDEWLEICMFLSPCDMFRLSQTCNYMYFHLFGLKKPSSAQQSQSVLFNLIIKQVSDHLELSQKETPWFVSDEEQLWIERKIQNRRDWKNLLRIYLRLSYLLLLNNSKKFTELETPNLMDCEFLIYQPFENIESDEKNGSIGCGGVLKLNLQVKEMNDPVLIHGYKDCDGKITIFNWERLNLKSPKELTITNLNSKLYIYSNDIESFFREIVESFTCYKSGVYDMIKTQEFLIPNRIFKFKVDSSTQMTHPKSELFKLGLHKCPAHLNIHTKPYSIYHSFSLYTLAFHIPFYYDLICLITMFWFMYKYQFNYDAYFRHAREMLGLPFRHPGLEDHEYYQYFSFSAFLALYFIYGGTMGILGSIYVPGFVSIISNIILRYFLNGIEYPESREFRSPWNLLSILELGQTIWCLVSTGKFCLKMMDWGKHWKRSIVNYFNSFMKKKKID